MHSDIDTLKRTEILRDLRLGVFDVLVGINLLREGLDLPEVELVAILDADREGFLRSETSLIQTFGRASRNADGRVILYADRTTNSMTRAVELTTRRRERQAAFNAEHGIVPTTVIKAVRDLVTGPEDDDEGPWRGRSLLDVVADSESLPRTPQEAAARIGELRKQMFAAARELEFERAAEVRDEILRLEKLALEL
jgi:excinuclease ABC subunit B